MEKSFDMRARIIISRIRKKLTQKQLGELIGVSQSAIYQWESGITKNIRSNNLFKLASALGVTADYIISGKSHFDYNGLRLSEQSGMAQSEREEIIREITKSISNMTDGQVIELYIALCK